VSGYLHKAMLPCKLSTGGYKSPCE